MDGGKPTKRVWLRCGLLLSARALRSVLHLRVEWQSDTGHYTLLNISIHKTQGCISINYSPESRVRQPLLFPRDGSTAGRYELPGADRYYLCSSCSPVPIQASHSAAASQGPKETRGQLGNYADQC